MARPYRPTLRPTPRAAVAMLCAAAGASLVLSVVWPRLGSVGDILFIGTLAPALLIGLLLSWVSGRTVFAHSLAAASLAILATLGAIGGAHYQKYRTDLARNIETAEDQRLRSLSFGRAEAEVNQEFTEALSAMTFANYLRTYFGLGDGHTPIDGASSKVGPQLGVGLYLAELLFAVLAAAYWPRARAREPACVQCHQWYQFADTRNAAHGVSKDLVRAMLANQLDDALALLVPPDTKEFVALTLAYCPSGCQSPALLRISDVSLSGRGLDLTSRHQADLVLSARETEALEDWT